MSMTEAQWLSPPVENELANRILIAYEEDSQRLFWMKEETERLMTVLENSHYINLNLKQGIAILLDKQENIITELEQNVEAMKDRLESMGVGA